MFSKEDEQIITELKKSSNYKCFELVMKDLLKEFLAEYFKGINKPEEVSSPLMTIADIARRFKVTKATVHNWKIKAVLLDKSLGRTVISLKKKYKLHWPNLDITSN